MAQEERRQETRLRDGAVRAAKTGMAVCGRFIPAADIPDAVHEARLAGVSAAFDGGYPEAERVQVCFFPEGEAPRFTRVWVEASWRAGFGTAEHRALLGSLLALGIDRSWFGDLIAAEEKAWLCCMPEAAVRLPSEWREAGRTALRVRVLTEAPALTMPEGTAVRETVASLRLDCILAAGMRCSRGAAAERIRRGEVSVNHRPEERIDRLLSPGDLLSVRGFGRIRLTETGAPTRKDRLPVILTLFGRKNG